MERDERYEINSKGSIVVGTPVTLTSSERKTMIEKMFSINGWKYTLVDEITPAHYYIELKNKNLNIERHFHLFHGNVRKEDPERNREEKKIQLGTDNDPRQYFDNALILGFYVYENKNSLEDVIVVAWPIEEGKNYPANPSLRVNMRTDVLPAKNAGYYVDKTTGKNLVAFRPEFIYHYIENYKDLHYGNSVIEENNNSDASTTPEKNNLCNFNSQFKSKYINLIVYGTPGCGKSWHVKNELLKDYKTDNIIRTTFYQDYTNTDFVGQIMPIVTSEDVTYKFNPGPFTLALRRAIEVSNEPVALLIEELNRGNAPSIFGDIFQLLDRENGKSEYQITNVNIQKYLSDNIPDMEFNCIMLPANLSIIATMNTSDQNVFTLDTAFKRRWEFKKLKNRFKADHPYKGFFVPGMDNTTWEMFVNDINNFIEDSSDLQSEDKQLGVFFVSEDLLCEDATNVTDELKEKFAYKVLEYLWDDVAKFERDNWFNSNIKSLDKLVEEYVKSGREVFKDGIFRKHTS